MAAYSNNRWPRALRMATTGAISVTCLVIGVALVRASDQKAAGEPPKQTSSATGSEAYKTTVDRKTKGNLTAEDLRQVSTLASQILTHIGVASDSLVEENWQKAKTELNNAQTLSKVIRQLLPITTVTTVVKDQQGKEIYRYEERVQDDQIPVYDNMVAVDVLQAVVDKKKEDANLKGIQLADAQVIHTSALLDLKFVDHRIARALKLVDEKSAAKAEEQLLLAQSRGVRFTVNRQDDPLVKAQAALRVAERMVREEKHEAADENLKLARLHLETYRTLLGEEGKAAVQKLQSEIQEMAGKTNKAGSTKEIRGFWDRVTSWFKSEPGQTHVNEGNPNKLAASEEKGK